MVRSDYRIFYADTYFRLSKDDGDKGESNSIVNQRKLINEFISASDNIQLAEEFYDDGYTGTNFERPGFQKMLRHLESGEANCVIVKDLSRLGRDYIETGKYIERIFPAMGIRFIAINDNVDTYRKDQADEIIVPFKNLINDSYCRELSLKLRRQFSVQRKNGEFIGNFACFGYRKSPEDKHKLIIDDTAADVVRVIYAKRIEGYSCGGIAKYLNNFGFLSPSDYKNSIGENYKSGFKESAQSRWSDSQVRRILSNRVYVGDLEQGKRSTPNYKVKKMITKSPEEWCVTRGAHEAIISEETYMTVQKVALMDCYTAPDMEKAYPLSGIIFCKDCGSSMVRRKVVRRNKEFCYYVCKGHKTKKICDSSHSVEKNALHERVLRSIQMQIRTVIELEKLIEKVGEHQILSVKIRRLEAQIEKTNQILAKQQEFRMKLYENQVEGLITHEEYLAMRRDYAVKMSESEEIIGKLETELQRAVEQNKMGNAWIEVFKDKQDTLELTRELVVTLIDRIDICADKSIEITFRFRDEYQLLKDYVDCVTAKSVI